jgi:hypothetical protein
MGVPMASNAYSSISPSLFEMHYGNKAVILNFYDIIKIKIYNIKLMPYAMGMQILGFDLHRNLPFSA